MYKKLFVLIKKIVKLKIYLTLTTVSATIFWNFRSLEVFIKMYCSAWLNGFINFVFVDVYDNLKWTFSIWNLWKYILQTYLYLLRNNTLNKEYLPSSSLARSPEIFSWYYEMYSLYNLLHTHEFCSSRELISFPWVFNLYQISSN